MRWLEPYFSLTPTGIQQHVGPCDVVHSRHNEVIAADPIISAIAATSGGVTPVPLGKWMETGKTPAIYTTIPVFDRQPAPGAYTEDITIRDIIRFKDEKITGRETLWTPSLGSLLSHFIRVVMANSQLTFDTGGPSGVIPLVSRCDLSAVDLAQVDTGASGVMDNILEMRIDFTYKGLIARSVHRLLPLVTAGVP